MPKREWEKIFRDSTNRTLNDILGEHSASYSDASNEAGAKEWKSRTVEDSNDDVVARGFAPTKDGGSYSFMPSFSLRGSSRRSRKSSSSSRSRSRSDRRHHHHHHHHRHSSSSRQEGIGGGCATAVPHVNILLSQVLEELNHVLPEISAGKVRAEQEQRKTGKMNEDPARGKGGKNESKSVSEGKKESNKGTLSVPFIKTVLKEENDATREDIRWQLSQWNSDRHDEKKDKKAKREQMQEQQHLKWKREVEEKRKKLVSRELEEEAELKRDLIAKRQARQEEKQRQWKKKDENRPSSTSSVSTSTSPLLTKKFHWQESLASWMERHIIEVARLTQECASRTNKEKNGEKKGKKMKPDEMDISRRDKSESNLGRSGSSRSRSGERGEDHSNATPPHSSHHHRPHSLRMEPGRESPERSYSGTSPTNGAVDAAQSRLLLAEHANAHAERMKNVYFEVSQLFDALSQRQLQRREREEARAREEEELAQKKRDRHAAAAKKKKERRKRKKAAKEVQESQDEGEQKKKGVDEEIEDLNLKIRNLTQLQEKRKKVAWQKNAQLTLDTTHQVRLLQESIENEKRLIRQLQQQHYLGEESFKRQLYDASQRWAIEEAVEYRKIHQKRSEINARRAEIEEGKEKVKEMKEEVKRRAKDKSTILDQIDAVRAAMNVRRATVKTEEECARQQTTQLHRHRAVMVHYLLDAVASLQVLVKEVEALRMNSVRMRESTQAEKEALENVLMTVTHTLREIDAHGNKASEKMVQTVKTTCSSVKEAAQAEGKYLSNAWEREAVAFDQLVADKL